MPEARHTASLLRRLDPLVGLTIEITVGHGQTNGSAIAGHALPVVVLEKIVVRLGCRPVEVKANDGSGLDHEVVVSVGVKVGVIGSEEAVFTKQVGTGEGGGAEVTASVLKFIPNELAAPLIPLSSDLRNVDILDTVIVSLSGPAGGVSSEMVGTIHTVFGVGLR